MAAQIELNEEQQMLLETAADFCRNQSPMEKVRAGINEQASVDAAVWQQMVELGWLGITIPEEHGGLGLGLSHVVPIMESMGRHLMGSPLFATVMATQAILTSGSETQMSDWLPKIAAGMAASIALTEADGNWNLEEVSATGTIHGDTIRLAGNKTFVLDAIEAAVIVASVRIDDQPRLVLIDQSCLPTGALERETVIDESRRSYSLCLDEVSVAADQLLPASDFAAIEQTAMILLCAEITGGMAGVLHVIVDYLTTRKQFDKHIGGYQALKHPTVQILLGLEAARSHLYHAATTLDQPDELTRRIALHSAKAQGSEAFAFAGDRAIQFHGGFGFTYECDAQLFLRRALWCQYQFGDERYHRQRLAPLLLDQSA